MFKSMTHDELMSLRWDNLPLEVKYGIEDIVIKLIDKDDIIKACAIRGYLVQLIDEDDYTLEELEIDAACYSDGYDKAWAILYGKPRARIIAGVN